MLCHGSGRSAAGGAVMPWPGIPILVHRRASWPGTGLAGGSAPAACSAATMSTGPVADKRAQVGRAGGRLLGVVLRDGRAPLQRIRAAMPSSRSSPGLVRRSGSR